MQNKINGNEAYSIFPSANDGIKAIFYLVLGLVRQYQIQEKMLLYDTNNLKAKPRPNHSGKQDILHLVIKIVQKKIQVNIFITLRKKLVVEPACTKIAQNHGYHELYLQYKMVQYILIKTIHYTLAIIHCFEKHPVSGVLTKENIGQDL